MSRWSLIVQVYFFGLAVYVGLMTREKIIKPVGLGSICLSETIVGHSHLREWTKQFFVNVGAKTNVIIVRQVGLKSYSFHIFIFVSDSN